MYSPDQPPETHRGKVVIAGPCLRPPKPESLEMGHRSLSAVDAHSEM